MSTDHQMPDDPSHHPEQALDAMEEKVFGSTVDQERDDSADPDQEDAEDASTAPPTTTESPA